MFRTSSERRVKLTMYKCTQNSLCSLNVQTARHFLCNRRNDGRESEMLMTALSLYSSFIRSVGKNSITLSSNKSTFIINYSVILLNPGTVYV